MSKIVRGVPTAGHLPGVVEKQDGTVGPPSYTA
jgi:hypothetical protein